MRLIFREVVSSKQVALPKAILLRTDLILSIQGRNRI
jgi:hypothetical protein